MASFDHTNSLSVISREGLLVETTLYHDNTIGLDLEIAEDSGRDGRLDLDEARRLHATLGHLIWVAENA